MVSVHVCEIIVFTVILVTSTSRTFDAFISNFVCVCENFCLNDVIGVHDIREMVNIKTCDLMARYICVCGLKVIRVRMEPCK